MEQDLCLKRGLHIPASATDLPGYQASSGSPSQGALPWPQKSTTGLEGQNYGGPGRKKDLGPEEPLS